MDCFICEKINALGNRKQLAVVISTNDLGQLRWDTTLKLQNYKGTE